MTNNRARKALLEQTVTLGSWIQINHPVIAEVMGNCGYDWIATNCEHTDRSPGGCKRAQGIDSGRLQSCI